MMKTDQSIHSNGRWTEATGRADRESVLQKGRSIAAQFLLCTTVLMVLLPGLAAGQEFEAELKAEFLERFTRFIAWPDSSTVGDKSVPFVIGVVGDDAMQGALENLAGRASIKGKTVQVRRVDDLSGISACQIVFIAGSQRGRLSEVLGAVRGKPILTVGDSEGYGRRGVMINFFRDGEFIRFELNKSSAENAGMQLANDLLGLAKVVN